ncbi:L,D-transpeptidase [Patescibacteria group bacterium]|nr:L,D-transpeptidase [Patescibacteria group bacterium]
MNKRFVIFTVLSLLVIILPALNFKLGKAPSQDRSDYVACTPNDLSGVIDKTDFLAYFEANKLTVPDFAMEQDSFSVLGLAHQERWVEIDLSEQKLKAWEGDQLFLETPVSTGLPWWPTPTGEFRIWIKLRATKMEGGEGKYYYYLPNVPYVMFFGNSEVPNWKGYGLHGTYWHDDFGTQRSHGCVNLPTSVARELYYWLDPVLLEGKSVVYSDEQNPGARVVIHE